MPEPVPPPIPPGSIVAPRGSTPALDARREAERSVRAQHDRLGGVQVDPSTGRLLPGPGQAPTFTGLPPARSDLPASVAASISVRQKAGRPVTPKEGSK